MPKERTLKEFVKPRQQRNRNRNTLSADPVFPIHTSMNTDGGREQIVNVQEAVHSHDLIFDEHISEGADNVDSESSIDSYNFESLYCSEEHIECQLQVSDEESPELADQREFKHKISNWAVVSGIPRTHLNKLLVILRSFEGLSFLPKDYRTLLKSARTVEVKSILPGNYFHVGLEYGVIRALFQSNLNNIPSVVRVFAGLDGSPLTKSTNSQFWPILGRIDDQQLSKQPFIFVIGIYHGDSKPANLDDYLTDFVDEALKLSTEGFIFRETRVKVNIVALLCDAPARAFVAAVKGHTAYYGCSKCETEGVYYKPDVNKPRSGRVIYPQLDAPLRTNASFRSRSQKDHHIGTSLLENLPLDMVQGIPLDSLHLTDLGGMRKLFNTWMNGKYMRVKLSNNQREELSQRIEQIRDYIPSEFQRKLGPLKLFDRWKGTCFRMIKLYVGPVILKNILSEELYGHFMLFHVAMKLLSNEDQCFKPDVIDYCEKLLVKFVKDSSVLYGPQFVSYNIHNMIHIARDVAFFGPLDYFSTYLFENHLQIIKHSVQTGGRALQQAVKRLGEYELNRMSVPVVMEEELVLIHEHYNGPNITGFHGQQYRTAKLRRWTLRNEKPDNCVFLNDGSVFIIRNFVKRNSQVVVVGQKFQEKIDFYSEPILSKIFAKGFMLPSFLGSNSFVVMTLIQHDRSAFQDE